MIRLKKQGMSQIYRASGLRCCHVSDRGPYYLWIRRGMPGKEGWASSIWGAKRRRGLLHSAPLYREGRSFTPVDTTVHTRPIMTKKQAQQLVDQIPQIPEEIYENSNPLVCSSEHYQVSLKSWGDCVELVRLIRHLRQGSQCRGEGKKSWAGRRASTKRPRKCPRRSWRPP